MRIEHILSQNNYTEDAMFWSELYDDNHHSSFYFSSLALNELKNTEDVIDRAYQILSIYEGIFKLCERRYEKYFSLDSLYNYETKKSIQLRINEPELYRIDFDISKLKNINKTYNPAYDLFANIIKDEYLTNLFFLLSRKLDYKLLYMVYDDIRYYLQKEGDRKFLKEFESKLKNFTHTANNYEVLGYFARHGRTVQKPPKNKMDLETSKILIFSIIEKLLVEKFNISIPKL